MNKMPSIEHAVQEMHRWINQLNEITGWDDQEKAYTALRVILQLLRDNLTLHTAAKLAAELSPYIRGLYYENWRPVEQPLRERIEEEFIENIQVLLDDYKHYEIDPELAAKSVFKVLKSNISPGEVNKVNAQLPRGIRRLFELS